METTEDETYAVSGSTNDQVHTASRRKRIERLKAQAIQKSYLVID